MKIAASELKKSYGDVRAVDGVTFSVDPGVCALVGPNGAGKTTLIRMLVTAFEPDGGEILYDGLDAVRSPLAVRPLIGYMPDFFGLYSALTVEEYLSFFARAYRIPEPEIPDRCRLVLETVRFSWKPDALVETLSRGMGQKVLFAKTLLHDPKVLILDEPASGLDPGARVELYEIIRNLAAAGKTILLSSHILGELSAVANQAIVLRQGRVQFSGSLDVKPDTRIESSWGPATEALKDWLARQPDCLGIESASGRLLVASKSDAAARELFARAISQGVSVDVFEIVRRRRLDSFFAAGEDIPHAD